MTDEEKQLFDSYQAECNKVFDIAQRLDCFNPELPGAFMGNPSDRIIRQLAAMNVAGFYEEDTK